MTRVKRGCIAHRTKIRLFSSTLKDAHSVFTKTTYQQKVKALVFSYQDRRSKKRKFRCLWIIRINLAIRMNKVFCSYSRLIYNLYKKKLIINRKILAQIIIINKNYLYAISNKTISNKNKNIF
uniref:50S ribosomal protein L20 n=1 Tax=Arachnitis uniflora TaxID=191246 RepID=A0A0K1H2J8_9LILI|nr:ribosomal protein L20 [Arachnitis uniflora]